ncbi:hypothetical protein [Streptomyces sp. NRRL S-646]|uniref:hypothetical protein n=1 Tax=Streptomyces sp. NRRL S-646 TaxID=1463917 RepID=UPI0004C688BE|nr:hypothetical protein [Streptomyces sp. NRRL S-646]
MRKFQQAMIAAVTVAGALAAIGAGAGTAYATDGAPPVTDHYRPYQECSPQMGAEDNTPLNVLGLSDTLGTICGQFENAFTR